MFLERHKQHLADLVASALKPQLDRIIQNQENKIMPGITDITAAQAAEKKDLVTLTGLIAQLLAAFASGAMTPAQAQSVLDEINQEDATVNSQITSIQAALPTPPAPTA